MINALLNLIASHGDKGAVVPVSRFEDLKREMEDLKSETYHAFSDWMAETMAIPQDLGFTPRSLIAVITPQSQGYPAIQRLWQACSLCGTAAIFRRLKRYGSITVHQ